MSSSSSYYGWVSDWMELVLKKVAQAKMGPTVTTRWIFIASHLIYNSYQFISGDKSPVDTLYWTSSEKGQISETPLSYTASWIEIACQYAIPILIRNYMNVPLGEEEIGVLIAKHQPLVMINHDSMERLKVLLWDYLQARDGDGWRNTMTFNGTLPNGSNVIYADNSVNQDLRTLPQPNLWTPLSIGGSTKNYLTPEWGTANKGVLSDADFSDLLAKTNRLVPSQSQYEKEMKEVSDITSKLTDEEKMIAEYWAGGPGTVTPPGMFTVFLDIYIRSNQVNLIDEIKNYTILGAGLYQSSISCWRLKRDHLQARPVQKLRQMQYGQAISEPWNSKTLGQYWLPYQELNFVTPPFPDFPSGHSTFGASTAKIFSYLFKSNFIDLKMPVCNDVVVSLLSPSLTSSGTENFAMNNFFLLPNTSTVESNVPSCALSLKYPDWNSMSEACGISRVYGGIHVQSSNFAGQYLGNMIGDKIWEMYKDI
jgi:hypothetical protein